VYVDKIIIFLFYWNLTFVAVSTPACVSVCCVSDCRFHRDLTTQRAAESTLLSFCILRAFFAEHPLLFDGRCAFFIFRYSSLTWSELWPFSSTRLGIV